MTRHVHEPDVESFDLLPSETEVDREAALLLLRPPVRVAPGQGFDECGLAVVDMAGCRNNGHLS